MTRMTSLARHIYRYLVRALRRGTASMTYAELAVGLGDKLALHPRSPRLFAALTEVTIACRECGVPAVTAMVWKAGARRPSDGFYRVAYPRSRSFHAQLAAWREEHARVLREAARLPSAL